jgi:hypothetical protein
MRTETIASATLPMDSSVDFYASLPELLIRHTDDDTEDTDSSGSMPGLEPQCKLDDDSSISSSDTMTAAERKLVNERDCWDVEGGIEQKGAEAQLPGGIEDNSSVHTGSDSSGSTMPGLVARIGKVQIRSMGVVTLLERLGGPKKNSDLHQGFGPPLMDARIHC